MSLGAGLVSAGAYAYGGHSRKARSALGTTLLNGLTGGRGKWVKSSWRQGKRISGARINSRYNGLIGLSLHSYKRGWVNTARRKRAAWGMQVGFNWLSWRAGGM